MIYGADHFETAQLIPMMVVGSIVAGMIWGLIPAFFKAHWNTNETLFTLMMNYVAMQIITFCIVFWENPAGSNTVGIINSKTKLGWLPALSGLAYGWIVVIVLVLTVAMFGYLKYSKQGYEISVVGESENTAKYVGINVKKVIMRTMAISGAICGLAGLSVQRFQPYDLHEHGGRTRIYCDHRRMALKIQHVYNGRDLLLPGFHGAGRRSDRLPVQLK